VTRFLRPGDVFFDVGANAGYYTVMAAAVVGCQGKVYAFEPNPDIAAFLSLSLKKNGLHDRVVVETRALGKAQELAKLHFPADDHHASEASLTPSWSTSDGRAINVQVVTLDEYCARHDIRAIRLMKIDVEGGEREVLAGAARVLQRIRPDAILCEFVPARRPEAQMEVLELFERNKYRAFSIRRDGSLSSHDRKLPQWEWGNLCFIPSDDGIAL
jgi:FkbM family methyltransferase